jgi:hypothetical protein
MSRPRVQRFALSRYPVAGERAMHGVVRKGA